MIESVSALKVDNSFAALSPQFYTRLATQPLTDPKLLHANPEVAALLGMSPDIFNDPSFLKVVSGQEPLPGGTTLAAVYSGHQFGVWAGQLGDGRAHLLGEVVSSTGSWELQLKGAGRTPYSRMGDGRAVLRSSVREYLAGEAMAGLGIPTTRALALVVSDDPVYRETVETAAIVTRVSLSFVRFGSFEHWSNSPTELRELFDYTVQRFYPECSIGAPDVQTLQDSVASFLRAVVARTARLMADWQTAGFCHGVMNTDNMSILGLTLDYGPYGFMDAFQADHVCNHSDTYGRYAWNTQPSVAHWNLYRLASALMGLEVPEEVLRRQLGLFESEFLQAYRSNLRNKFGLAAWEEGDDDLVERWWRLLHAQRADFTLSFRSLLDAIERPDDFLKRFADRGPAEAWLTSYIERVGRDGSDPTQRREQMRSSNPLYVLRNHLAEGAIRAAAAGDASEIERLLELLRDPYTEKPGFEAYAAEPPEWAGQLQVSCSS
jgi:uncharacterized protein YdiU (UPF0061 family)